MNSRYSMFEPHEKAPRSSCVWPGSWSMYMLHELESDKRAPTAPNDTLNIQAIGYGSVLFGILGASILAMITFLECICLLISPWLQTLLCSCCVIHCCSSRISNERDARRLLRPGNLSLRKKRNKGTGSAVAQIQCGL